MLNQDPPEGSEVEPGATVTIFVRPLHRAGAAAPTRRHHDDDATTTTTDDEDG